MAAGWGACEVGLPEDGRGEGEGGGAYGGKEERRETVDAAARGGWDWEPPPPRKDCWFDGLKHLPPPPPGIASEGVRKNGMEPASRQAS